MVKTIKKVAIYVSVLFILSACSSPEGDELEEIGNNSTSGIQPPKGCEIVGNMEEFESVTQDQSYNKETDANNSFDVYFGGTDTGEVLYVNSNGNWFIYYDKNTGNSGLLCGKPDCEHNSESCNAFIDGCWGVQYYNGTLYTVKTNDDDMILEKLSFDGSEREELGSMLGVKTVVENPRSSNTVEWIIHRGYIYYWYRWRTGGMDEDYYYLNNSHCIYRKALDKDSEPECIIAMPMLSQSVQFAASGSYVYMAMTTADAAEGYLYRYNIENGKLEWFKEWGNEISGVAVHDGKIYYSDNNRSEQKAKVYCYDTETEEKSVIIETEGLFGTIRYDEEYMYIGYGNKDEADKIGMWSWQGEYIADVPFYSEFNEEGRLRIMGGSDDENIYVWCMVANQTGEKENIYGVSTSIMGSYVIIEYIEKKDILDDGEYEIKEWSEIASKY